MNYTRILFSCAILLLAVVVSAPGLVAESKVQSERASVADGSAPGGASRVSGDLVL